MLNIVIPMAGRGSRFANAGFQLPKPLIEIYGKPMIEIVTENVRPKCEHQFIYLCLSEHLKKYDLEKRLQSISPGSFIMPVNKVTEGAACTVLLAKELINTNDSLMIVNSDQYIETNIDEYLTAIRDCDGLIMTMKASDKKWSFIQYNEAGYVQLVREKEVISSEATVGIYNFRQGKDFVKYAEEMINKNIRVNNEFYVAPVYNQMIEDNKLIRYYNIGSVENHMYGLGTPEDLEVFLHSGILT